MKKILWSANSLKDILNSEHQDIYDICFDSRLAKKGSLFFALNGLRDGHDFIQNAIDNGAIGVVVSKTPSSALSVPYFLVDDVFLTLQKIAMFRKSLFKGTIICVTGSVGKTTFRNVLTKKLLASGFAAQEPVKNFNNLLGVLFTFANIDLDTDFLVMEIGTNHPGEIDALASIVTPDISVITHIAPAHIGHFDGLKDILNEKAQIIRHTKKMTFFNGNLWFSKFLNDFALANNVPFRHFEHADSAIGLIQNALAAVLRFLAVDVPIDPSDFEVDGRNNLFSANFNNHSIAVLDSSYNANLASMIHGLKHYSDLASGFPDFKKVVILSSMLECGKREKRYHEALAYFVKGFDLILVGQPMKALYEIIHTVAPSALFFDSVDMLLNDLPNLFTTDSFVFVKGSSHALKPVVEFFKKYSVE